MKYSVVYQAYVSSVVEVEANSIEEALELNEGPDSFPANSNGWDMAADPWPSHVTNYEGDEASFEENGDRTEEERE